MATLIEQIDDLEGIPKLIPESVVRKSILNVSEATWHRIKHAGDGPFPAVVIHGRRYFRVEVIEDWLKSKEETQPPTKQLKQDADLHHDANAAKVDNRQFFAVPTDWKDDSQDDTNTGPIYHIDPAVNAKETLQQLDLKTLSHRFGATLKEDHIESFKNHVKPLRDHFGSMTLLDISNDNFNMYLNKRYMDNAPYLAILTEVALLDALAEFAGLTSEEG